MAVQVPLASVAVTKVMEERWSSLAERWRQVERLAMIDNANFNDNINFNDDAIYDLMGRKIEDGKLSNCKLPKGIYIVNGKKTVVK